ncbi:uncharacterized protein MEPE_00143 [Melanopsichium pennsylvanicum]|uniref:Uncharacterized protein n=2 Tax=Melanopsichium pennsylvanicum TaxID=63383 RepID=A0AAJ4XG01_9BASI|nr:putative protein [Melanopsichium pennsylvanicum 4]SNX81438.1 uncharacterized protein MEPE_00143 [Melanopsichium pennsylvanicum]
MLFNSKLHSALVAMVTLAISSASARPDPVEQHLHARDGNTFSYTKGAQGKLATPVYLGKNQVGSQTILKLTGQDMHTDATASKVPGVDDSKIAVSSSNGSGTGDAIAKGGNKAHCSLGHATANIRRIRYTMTMKLDQDESGTTRMAKTQSERGMVLKATSGLYSTRHPDQGSCAKTLARHGETCANRPYIVPNSIIPKSSSSPDVVAQGKGSSATALGSDPASKAGEGTDAHLHHGESKSNLEIGALKYQSGPYKEKRAAGDMNQPLGLEKVDQRPSLVFKRDATTREPAPDSNKITSAGGARVGTGFGTGFGTGADGNRGYSTDVSRSSSHFEASSPLGLMCIDTVKRDAQVTKVVPTNVRNSAAAPITDDSAPLHFELVRSDSKEGIWNQNIYDQYNNLIDVTHLKLTSNMAFWRAEFYCAECKPGHREHKVYYEGVEIEMDESHEHITPEIQCEGEAQSSGVQKKDESRYAGNNKSGVDYKGLIYSVDQVTLGMWDKNGRGGTGSITLGHGRTITGEVPVTDTTPRTQTAFVKDSKTAEGAKSLLTGTDDSKTSNTDVAEEAAGSDPSKKKQEDIGKGQAGDASKKPETHIKRDVVVETDGLIF